jgi:hypothetical protein
VCFSSEYAKTRLGETSASETVPHGIPQGCLVRGFVGLIRDDRSEIGQIELSEMLMVQVGRGSSAPDTISWLFRNLTGGYQQG